MVRQALFVAVGIAMVTIGLLGHAWTWVGVGAADIVIFSVALFFYATRIRESYTGTSATVAVDPSSGSSSLIFTRAIEGDRARRYRIVVDGKRVGALGPGDSLTVALPSGRHTYRATLDWTGSPEYNVDLASSEQVSLVARRSPSASYSGRTGWILISPA